MSPTLSYVRSLCGYCYAAGVLRLISFPAKTYELLVLPGRGLPVLLEGRKQATKRKSITLQSLYTRKYSRDCMQSRRPSENFEYYKFCVFFTIFQRTFF